MRLMLLAALCIALLTGCPGQARKPDLPSGTVVKPEAVLVERRVHVAIPERLTEELPIAEGPVDMCWPVAADRRAQLVKANARFREIAEIEGTAVEDDAP